MPDHKNTMESLRHNAGLTLQKKLQILQLGPSCCKIKFGTFAVAEHQNRTVNAAQDVNGVRPARVAGADMGSRPTVVAGDG